jgi:hypothetical protein
MVSYIFTSNRLRRWPFSSTARGPAHNFRGSGSASTISLSIVMRVPLSTLFLLFLHVTSGKTETEVVQATPGFVPGVNSR